VPNSSSQRVLWLLEETGEPYELTILGDRQSRLADPEHMRRHPLGRVPVLDDDGNHIFESGAICLYVADKYPQAGLLPPSGTPDRGLVYQWSLFATPSCKRSSPRSDWRRDHRRLSGLLARIVR